MSKPTNEELRAWAALEADEMTGLFDPVKVKVEAFGVVQVTERAAFVQAWIEVPLNEDGSIAE